MASDLKELLQKVIEEKDGLRGLEVTEVKESPCTKPGDNYMSVVSVAEVMGELPVGKSVKRLPFSTTVFLKRQVPNPGMKELCLADQAFINEATMYLKVFPLYDVTMPCPRCYHADKDLIVLEDLGKSGYKMADRKKGFDLETAKLVIKALATYHAASYHASTVNKNEFEKVTSLFKPINVQTSEGGVMLEGMFQQLLAQLEGVTEMKPVVEIMKRVQGKLHQTLMELGRAKKIPVLCHGDFWINNILVRSEAEVPVQLMDFQQCRGITSPVVDVWPFMYTSLKPSVMDDNFEELLQIYCKSFVEDLTSMKTPSEKIPSTAEILEDLTSNEFFGVLIGSLYMPALTMDPGSMTKMEDFTKEQLLDPNFMQQIMQELMMASMKDKMAKLFEIALKRGVFSKLKGAL